MTNNSSIVDNIFDSNSRSLGAVLDALSAEGRKKNPTPLPLESLLNIPEVAEQQNKSLLIGALTVLHGMGLISVDERGRVKISNRYAGFAVASLSEFIKSNVPAVEDPVDENEKRYLVDLTKSLESAREQKVSEGQNIGNAPLHSRRIVNVLIKSRQIRQWKMQDVYLHVYHNQWKQYHLVGLSHKDYPAKSDEDIAKLALEQQVGLTPTQYDIDQVFNPQPVVARRISATSGVLTEYTYRLMTVKIKIKLALKKQIQNAPKESANEQKTIAVHDRDWFRWFTWEEIQQGVSLHGEPIMFSTPLMLKEVDLDSFPVNAPKADDLRSMVGISRELGNRFTAADVVLLASLFVVIISFVFLPQILATLGSQIPALDNLAKLFQIAGVIVTIVITIWKFRKQARS